MSETGGWGTTDFTLVEKLARALYPLMVHGGDYSEVPYESMMRRPRYAHLKRHVLNAVMEVAKTIREPTDQMVDAAMTADGSGMPLSMGYDEVWQRMADHFVNASVAAYMRQELK